MTERWRNSKWVAGLALSACLSACAGAALAQDIQAPPVSASAQPAAEPAQTAQSPASPTVLPDPTLAHPGDTYRDAMRPLDVVRSSLDNWSDAELQALGAGIHKAAAACAQSRPEQYAGNDLYDLIRLCALGQAWNQAHDAATAYIASGLEPHRAQAYALAMNAQVHGNDLNGATEIAFAMLRKLPYDAEVAYAIRYLVDYVAQSGDLSALTLAAAQHPAILTAIAAGVPLKSASGDAVIGIGALYDSALTLAFLERYARDDRAAAATVADLKAALAALPPTALSAEDRQTIAAVDTRYALVGARLPDLDLEPLPSLAAGKSHAAHAPFNAGAHSEFGAATVLLLFPDWCAQCRRMMKTAAAFAAEHSQARIHVYGLMFVDQPAGAPGAQPAPAHLNPANTRDLDGTPTWIAAATIASSLGATDFPFAIVTDSAGRIQYLAGVPSNAFEATGYLSYLANLIAGGATPSKGAPAAHTTHPVH